MALFKSSVKKEIVHNHVHTVQLKIIIITYIYIYIYIQIISSMSVGVLGPEAHYPCMYWAQSPCRRL